jgi:hypothetical protein
MQTKSEVIAEILTADEWLSMSDESKMPPHTKAVLRFGLCMQVFVLHRHPDLFRAALDHALMCVQEDAAKRGGGVQ